MKLTSLKPRWFTSGFEADGSKRRIGLTFECPCPKCRAGVPVRLAIPLANPPDGGPPVPMSWKLIAEAKRPVDFDVPAEFLWGHTGTTFEDLTLNPSVDASASGHWHGWVRNGEVT